MSYTMTQACGETDKDAPVVMESPPSGPEHHLSENVQSRRASPRRLSFTQRDPGTVLLPFVSSVEWP